MAEFEFLKQRAKEFFENAKYLFDKGQYNLSAFNLEQTVQLWLKYLTGIKAGEWPKTHYLNQLIEELGKVWDNKDIVEYYRKNEFFFETLSDSYFTSRYFPKNFSENLVKMLIEKSEEFFEFLERITGEKFYL